MILQKNINNQIVYYQMNTKNQSFINMHYFLKAKGINNNDFFLILFDKDLANIDPTSDRLPTIIQAKIMAECRRNFWYFAREVVRIVDQGGAVGSGVMYKLNRGNLALNFGFSHNWSMFLELPRQFGKTISAVIWYLWVFLFHNTNTEMMFINKKLDDAKVNLGRLKDIRENLPIFLQMSQHYSDARTNKTIKVPDRAETVQHPINKNIIKTMPGARSKTSANGLGRGLTMPIHWYDEYAWILYNSIIRSAATPSFSTASKNAKRNGVSYGILLTTTPGLLTTDEGRAAFATRNNATKFLENYYDFSPAALEQLILDNTKSPFVHIIFSYIQLGEGQEYLKKQITDLEGDYDALRREVLLEWAESSKDCPFSNDDLDKIKSHIKDSRKVSTILLCGHYPLYIYEKMNDRYYPPIIGVDVSGGYDKDSSAITIIDSKTTKVIACLNCNYISIQHLAACIYELVTKHMNNAVVNIERNGGFGLSLISNLLTTKIKRNLYFEIKERVLEERFDGIHTNKVKQKRRVFGSDNTANTRKLLMEILRERVEYHKDKFNSDILYNELKSMEVKKNGRIEHSSTSHDDQIFSYLWALYVWYYGADLMDNWGIIKNELKTDQNGIDEISIEEETATIEIPLVDTDNSELSNSINESLNILKESVNFKTYEQWIIDEELKNQASFDKILSTREGRLAVSSATGITYDENDPRMRMFMMPDDTFIIDDGEDKSKKSELQKMFDEI